MSTGRIREKPNNQAPLYFSFLYAVMDLFFDCFSRRVYAVCVCFWQIWQQRQHIEMLLLTNVPLTTEETNGMAVCTLTPGVVVGVLFV